MSKDHCAVTFTTARFTLTSLVLTILRNKSMKSSLLPYLKANLQKKFHAHVCHLLMLQILQTLSSFYPSFMTWDNQRVISSESLDFVSAFWHILKQWRQHVRKIYHRSKQIYIRWGGSQVVFTVSSVTFPSGHHCCAQSLRFKSSLSLRNVIKLEFM